VGSPQDAKSGQFGLLDPSAKADAWYRRRSGAGISCEGTATVAAVFPCFRTFERT